VLIVDSIVDWMSIRRINQQSINTQQSTLNNLRAAA